MSSGKNEFDGVTLFIDGSMCSMGLRKESNAIKKKQEADLVN